MKKIVWSLSICIFLLCGVSIAFADSYRVAIFDFDLRSEGQRTVAGHIETRLRQTGLSFSTIRQYTGYEDENRSLAILEQIEAEGYDLVITVTSDAMIPAYHKLKKTPVLFTNVNNPKFYGIKDLAKPGRNRSGVTYYVPVAKQIAYFQRLTRTPIKKLGLIFDSTAKSRVAELRDFREEAEKTGIETVIALVDTTEDLPKKSFALVGKGVDAILLTSSNKVYKNAGVVVAVADDKQIPVFSVNKEGVSGGAIFAFASDYYLMVDQHLIPMAVDVLTKGVNPGDMPVRHLQEPALYLNLTQAKKLGLTIPEDIIARSIKTY